MNLLPDPPEDIETFVTLHGDFDGAIIGHTFDPDLPPRFCYSLELLTAIVMALESVGDAMARANVATMMQAVRQAEGDRAPVFIDDKIRVDRQSGVIVMPN